MNEKKNELEERYEYLLFKEKKERYIKYILAVLLIISLIFIIIYMNSKKSVNKEELAYVNESDNNIREESFIRFIYDGFNHNNPPSKKEYEVSSVSCNNAKGTWDNNKWELKLSGIVDKVSCSLTFKKKENIIAYKKVNISKLNEKEKVIKQEYSLNEIKEDDIVNDEEKVEEQEEEFKEEILFDYDKCAEEDCDYKVSMDTNKSITLNPKVKTINLFEGEIKYELVSGNEAVNLYNEMVCSKNITNKEAIIKVSANNLSVIVKVLVEAKLINTRIYPINRHNGTINYIDVKTNLQTYKNNFMNKIDYIHVFDKNNNELSNKNTFVGTGMKTKIIMNNKETDELEMIVLGDIDGDGLCNSADQDLLSEYLIGNIQLSGSKLLAADVDRNNKVNDIDYELIDKYIENIITSFPIP